MSTQKEIEQLNKKIMSQLAAVHATENILNDCIITTWEGHRLLVQRLTKHQPIRKSNRTGGYMWLSCIDLDSCERVRLKCKYKRLVEDCIGTWNMKFDYFVNKSVWKIGSERLYIKEVTA